MNQPIQRSTCDLPSEFDADGSGTASGTGELSLNTAFEILKNRRRRDTLEFLRTHGGRTTLSDLAEHIAAAENGIEVAQLSSAQRKRVYIGLYQCHLPKMDAAGVVDFDKNRGTVVLREEAAQLEQYLAPDADVESTRFDTEGGLAAVLDAFVSAVVGVAIGLVGLLVLAPASGVVAAVALVVGGALVVAVMAARTVIDWDSLVSRPRSGE